jgi:hypothetical protein
MLVPVTTMTLEYNFRALVRMRSINNLLEHFHESFLVYLLLVTSRPPLPVVSSEVPFCPQLIESYRCCE